MSNLHNHHHNNIFHQQTKAKAKAKKNVLYKFKKELYINRIIRLRLLNDEQIYNVQSKKKNNNNNNLPYFIYYRTTHPLQSP